MKIWFAIAVLSIISTRAVAQTRPFNTVIQGNFGRFGIPRPLGKIVNLGISADRKISKHWSIGGQYQRWIWNPLMGQFQARIKSYVFYYDLARDLKNRDNYYIGRLAMQANYRFADIRLRRHFYISDRHDIYCGGGLSYAQGYNSYVTRVDQFPGYGDRIINTSELALKIFLGTHLSFGYDFAAIGKRVNIGVNTNIRYFTNDLLQYDLNFVLGYNFSFLKGRNEHPPADPH